QTEEAQDDDYGAVDDTVIDTYIGSFNTGDKAQEWLECMTFFKLDPAAIEITDQWSPKTKGRKRVPIKKIPGMSVGLFDYQLMGVFKLLKLTLDDVPGGFLSDEQGLGKTQEMFGLVALAYSLRRSKSEVLAERKSKSKAKRKHNAADSDARVCAMDGRYGFQCYCYGKLTQELADRLPEGPNVILAPTRSSAQLLRDAKSKLDTNVIRIRSQYEGADRQDKLTAADIKTLAATVTLGQYLIITTPQSLRQLTVFDFGIQLRMPDGKLKKRDGLLPGIIMLDEFHEYAISQDKDQNMPVAWLDRLGKASEGRQPLAYFVSGTPLEDSPADIRLILSLWEREWWHILGPSHPMSSLTLASFDKLTATYDALAAAQAKGEMVPREDVAGCRRRLNAVFRSCMVRRLGTDSFRGRPLTNLGPLSVNIVNHQLLVGMKEASSLAALTSAETTGQFLRSPQGEALLLRLRLASTFPATACASSNLFTFTNDEVHAQLKKAGGDLVKTAYFTQIPAWSANSPKLATIAATIATMLADRSQTPGSPSTAKKLVLFTALESEAALLHGWLLLKKARDKRLKPVWIHGGLGAAARQAVVDSFLEQGNAPPNILVASVALAGTGLNLQRARYSVVTSPAWTKREVQQAYYRVHRVGQTQETRLQLLVSRWNPAERVIFAKYEGKEVEADDLWTVGDDVGESGERGLVEKHQAKGAEV
ncbi:hypothetical protein B0H67DRAFT_444880, partial [Lasiosphaeris hirsuta]